MDGIKIPFSESVKYLGVTLDSKVNWKQASSKIDHNNHKNYPPS